MPGSRNDSDMQFERHGKYAAVLVSFQTACGNQALGFEDGAGYSEPIGPMTVFGLKLDPVRFFQVIEVDDPNFSFLQASNDILLRHDLGGWRVAPLPQSNGLCAHFPKLINQGHQGVVLGRAWTLVRCVEVGLDQDVFS